jgi:hypothetical protein
MPADDDNNALCWECSSVLPEDGKCKCGHEADLFERIGFDREKCQHCNANFRNGLCLNGCSLPGWQYRMLMQIGPILGSSAYRSDSERGDISR